MKHFCLIGASAIFFVMTTGCMERQQQDGTKGKPGFRVAPVKEIKRLIQFAQKNKNKKVRLYSPSPEDDAKQEQKK